jgi:hypothetical protein
MVTTYLCTKQRYCSKVELRQWLKPDETVEESEKAIKEIEETEPTVDDILGTRGGEE